jgi:light-regulated signal transduction histidine kinase (bacteriophytochrome)
MLITHPGFELSYLATTTGDTMIEDLHPALEGVLSMPVEKADKADIFKRYKRANKERGGFGLGLDIVHSICKRYGIKIELESEKGKGSRFMLIFP